MGATAPTSAPPAPSTRPLADVAPIAALLLTFTMAMRPLADPDFFWHLATGRQMYATHTIPKLDPFSWSAVDRPWIAHEWLTESVIWPIWRLGGPGTGDALMVVLFALVITGAFALLWRCAEDLGATRTSAAAMTLLAALASRHTFNPRPQMLSLLLTVWLVKMLLAPRGRPRLRYWHPVLIGVWANLHGGFFLGLVLVLVAAAVELVHWGRSAWRGRRSAASLPSVKPLLRPLVVGAGAVLGALANPNETEGLLYPLRYLREYRPMMRFNAEWQSPLRAPAAYLPFLLLLLVAGVAARIGRARPSLLEGAVVAIAVALGCSAVRNVPVTAAVIAPLAARWASAAAARLAAERDARLDAAAGTVSALIDGAVAAPAGSAAARAPRVPIAARPLPARGLGVAMSLSLLFGGALTVSGTRQARQPDAFEALFPTDTLVALRAAQAQRAGRVFNAHDFGGWLIWNEVVVSMDGRSDMYGTDLFIDELRTWSGAPGWDERLDRDQVRYVLVEPTSGLAHRLAAHPAWRRTAADAASVLYERL